MKALKVLVGLVYDDPRLVVTLALGMIISAILAATHLNTAAVIVLWAALPLSLWISIRAELRKRVS